MNTRQKKQKSQRPPREGYNTLPTKVTRKEFNRFIAPHLSQRTRGQKGRLSYYQIFNHILYVLHTGIQWENLPVRGVHWSNVYKHHNRWSKDGSYERLFGGSLDHLAKNGTLDFVSLHGAGSNVVAKKGVNGSATRGTSINAVKKPLLSMTIPALCSLRALRPR